MPADGRWDLTRRLKGHSRITYFGNFRLCSEDHFFFVDYTVYEVQHSLTVPVCLETENLYKKACYISVHCLPSRMLPGSPVWSLLLNQYDDTLWILNVVALPKHKLVELDALSCKVGGDRCAVAVDASNISTCFSRLSSAEPRILRGKYPTIQPRPILSTSYPVFFF